MVTGLDGLPAVPPFLLHQSHVISGLMTNQLPGLRQRSALGLDLGKPRHMHIDEARLVGMAPEQVVGLSMRGFLNDQGFDSRKGKNFTFTAGKTEEINVVLKK